MRDLRVEITDEGSALYVTTDPDGVWAKTTQPDDLITVDWDAQGRVIGIEVIGSAAKQVIQALLQAIENYPSRELGKVAEALGKLIGKKKEEEE